MLYVKPTSWVNFVITGQQMSGSGKLYQKKTVLTAMPSQPDGTGTCKMGLVATTEGQDS